MAEVRRTRRGPWRGVDFYFLFNPSLQLIPLTPIFPPSSSRYNHRRQSSASRSSRHGTATTKQRINHDNFSLTTIRLAATCLRKGKRQHASNCATNCAAKLHSHFHEARKIVCNNLPSVVQAHVTELPLYAKQALPLVWTRFLRLAKSSPKIARSPARRSRDCREPSGKKSGEISRLISAQHPGNGRTVTTAMPLNVRQDDSQDNLPCAGLGHAISAPETCETTHNLAVQQPRNGQGNVSQAARVNFAVSF